jgi:hypothetical protein
MHALALATTLMAAVLTGTQAPRGGDAPPPPAGAPVTMIRQQGTIVGFDPAERVLTLKTRNATERFTVTPATRIRDNGQDVAPADLQKFTGRRARVRHPDASDVASSIDVSAPR